MNRDEEYKEHFSPDGEKIQHDMDFPEEVTPPPQCNSCGKVMVEVGELLKNRKTEEGQSLYGISQEVTLYQCPSCKDIKLI